MDAAGRANGAEGDTPPSVELEPRRRRKLNRRRSSSSSFGSREAGNSAAAWQLRRWLHGCRRQGARPSASGRLGGVPDGSEPTRKLRRVAVGKEYVFRNQDRPEEWLGKNVLYYPAAAGYRYLCLIDHLRSGLVQHHSEIWPNWTSIVVAFAPNAEDRAKQLTARAYRAVPERVIAMFEKLLTRDHERHDFPFPV